MGSSILGHMPTSSASGIVIEDIYKTKYFSHDGFNTNPLFDINITTSHIGKVALIVTSTTCGVNGLVTDPVPATFNTTSNATDLAGWTRVFNASIDKNGRTWGINNTPGLCQHSSTTAYCKKIVLSDVGTLLPTTFINNSSGGVSTAIARFIFSDDGGARKTSIMNVAAGGSVYHRTTNVNDLKEWDAQTGIISSYIIPKTSVQRSSEQATFQFFSGISDGMTFSNVAGWKFISVQGDLSDDARGNVVCSFNLYYRFIHGVSYTIPSVSYTATTNYRSAGMGSIILGR